MAHLTAKEFAAWRATHPVIAGGDPTSLQELRDRQAAIKTRLQEIHTEFSGQALPDNIRSEWNELNEERDKNVGLIRELEVREERVRAIMGDEDARGAREPGAHFNVQRPGSNGDPYDYTHVRSASPDGQRQMLRDQALRAVERSSFPHPEARQEDCQTAVDRLLRQDDATSSTALRILNTGNPVYQRAFGKALQGQFLSPEENRALGLTNSAGGYAVPYTLDPTIIPTSNYSVNPYRAISRVEQITTTTWQGITSAGVTATRRSEAAEAADNSPTIAQPSVTVQRVDVFIPYSIEIGQDWAGMQAQMAQLIQDAKDDEEAASFTTGSGTPPAAQGVVTGATNTVSTAGTAAFAVADLYNLETNLPARFRPRAAFVGNRSIYNRVRQFDTQGGASLWTDNLQIGLPNNQGGQLGARLLGYPAYEATSTASALTTGSKILIFGDFNYYIIVDRVGMDVELVPHLFGTNRRPTGQRGMFAVWRNNAAVIDPAAFRVLVTA